MCSALVRPYLDSSEHGGTLDAVGMTIRGEPAFGRAYQSRHNLVFGGSKDPNHDAVMRIGGEAPRRRTHSFPRHKAMAQAGEPLELVARETNVSIARLTEWRERALAGAATALKERERDDRDDEIARLKSKVGEITMDNELLYAKIEALEGKRPLAHRRSRR